MDKLNLMLNHKTVTEDQIPSISLYMDQVTGYLDEIFNDYKRNDEEKILTKTMINNYVKAGRPCRIKNAGKYGGRNEKNSMAFIVFDCIDFICGLSRSWYGWS